MIQIEFEYIQEKIIIQARLDETFQEVIDRFIQKSQIQLNSVYFISNDNKIKPEQSLESIMTDMDKQNQRMKVLVNKIEDKNNDKHVIIKSKDIICPKCGEPCRITLEDCKIKLFGCINNHTTNGIKLLDFPNTQKVDISKIICDKCKVNNKGDSTDHKFYKCLTCKNKLCILCKSKHDSNHNIIKDDQINNICPKHNEQLIKYCEQCNLNICFSCDEEHRNHKTIYLVDLKPNIDKAKNQLIQLKKEIDFFKNEVQLAIMKLNELKEAMDIFYGINNDILNIYEMKNRNYQILENLKLIDNNEIFKKLKEINEEKDFNNNKIINIIDLYSEISLYKKDLLNMKQEEKQDLSPKKNLTSKVDLLVESDIDQKKLQNMKMMDIQDFSSKELLICKIVLLGEAKAGKTTLLTSYISNEYTPCYVPTIGALHEKIEYFKDLNRSIKFEIWDTGGKERYRNLIHYYMGNAKALILVYDITNRSSFDKIRNYWLNQVKNYSGDDVSKKK